MTPWVKKISAGERPLTLREVESLWDTAAFAALDFETTGLDCITDRICEIGAVQLSPDGTEQAVFELLVNPGRPISPDASRVNGITDSMVRDSPPADETIPALLDFLGDSILTAHNAPFDLGFLKAAASRAGLRTPRYRVADTRNLAREAFPGLPSYSLQNLARHFGLDSGNAHRACDDARTCLKLLALCVHEARKTRPAKGTNPRAEEETEAP